MARYTVMMYKDVKQSDPYWSVGETYQLSDKFIDINKNTTLTDVCKQLKEWGCVDSYDVRRKVTVSSLDSDIIEIKQKSDRMPVCRLERTILLGGK